MFHHYRDKTTFKITMVPSQELLFLRQENLFPLTDGFTKTPNSPRYLIIHKRSNSECKSILRWSKTHYAKKKKKFLGKLNLSMQSQGMTV